MVQKLLMLVRTEIHCVMPALPFQTDISNWYSDQDKNQLMLERMGCLMPRRNSNLVETSSDEIQRYFVKYRSEDSEDVLFLVPKALSRLFFPHFSHIEDVQFAMSTVCVEHMIRAIVTNCADGFWALTVSELIQLLRASRTPCGTPGNMCGAMKYVHECAAKILNWRIIQAYDVSAAEDFMQVSFLLSVEDGTDIAWSQWNVGKQLSEQCLIMNLATSQTFDECEFQEKGIVIKFGIEKAERQLAVTVNVHVARLRSVFIQGLLSFPRHQDTNTLPTLDLTTICTQEARETFLQFFMIGQVPKCVSIECAFQLWDVSEWMQVSKHIKSQKHHCVTN